MNVSRSTRSEPQRQFWVLGAFLAAVFMLGGSSQSDVSSLVLLRPLAILVFAYGLFTLDRTRLRQYRSLLILFAAIVLLVIAHLIPLPPAVWQALPGRAIIRDVDTLAAIRDQWRPLSMVPQATLNALYTLAVPAAVLVLAVQLGQVGHFRLVILLASLITLGGAVGLLQASGARIFLYSTSSDVAGLFSNRNHQGVLLGIAFPLLAVAAFRAERMGFNDRWAKIVAAAVAVIIVPLILVTGSRAALGAAAVGVFSFPLLRLGRGMGRGGSRKKLALIGGTIAFSIVAAVALLMVLSARDNALGRIDATANDPRYAVWASIVEVLPNYMPWGSGVGSYATVYQVSEPAELLRPTFSNHAHNDYLETLFTAGLPGMLILLGAAFLVVIAAWRSGSAPDSQASFCRLGLVIIAILALASAVDYPVRTPTMSAVLVLAAVWAASMRKFGYEVEGK